MDPKLITSESAAWMELVRRIELNLAAKNYIWCLGDMIDLLKDRGMPAEIASQMKARLEADRSNFATNPKQIRWWPDSAEGTKARHQYCLNWARRLKSLEDNPT